MCLPVMANHINSSHSPFKAVCSTVANLSKIKVPIMNEASAVAYVSVPHPSNSWLRTRNKRKLSCNLVFCWRRTTLKYKNYYCTPICFQRQVPKVGQRMIKTDPSMTLDKCEVSLASGCNCFNLYKKAILGSELYMRSASNENVTFIQCFAKLFYLPAKSLILLDNNNYNNTQY